ncbi:uncharacterized protein LOC126576869 [Anopheles aquasalis]|uniref:uncharacterized protein LOC126576869 n=1 Tax=Anopheles aquasalis TaxID=42839 RepID=UPI00215A977B|nr:uncharacterized protein LOC126576869 [Anopheles aquasalis]
MCTQRSTTEQEDQHADPIVVFHYRDSPTSSSASVDMVRGSQDMLDWSRLQREAALASVSMGEYEPSLEGGSATDVSLISTETISDDSAADEARLKIAWDVTDENSEEETESESGRSTIVSLTLPARRSSRAAPYTNRRMVCTLMPNNTLPKDTLEGAKIPIVYHRNMARTFPGHDTRTPEQQRQRQRNTEAARISRAKTKLLEQLMEKEMRDVAAINANRKRMVATQREYVNRLANLLHLPRSTMKMYEKQLADEAHLRQK